MANYLEDTWLQAVIGVVGGAVLIFLLIILLCCVYRCYVRRRKVRSYSYLNYQSPLHGMEDSISYRSLEFHANNSNSHPSSAALLPANGGPGSGSGGPGSSSGSILLAPTAAPTVVAMATSTREKSVYEALESKRVAKEMNSKEAALMNCRYYLRNSQHYILVQQLVEMGSRVHKSWFMVHPMKTSENSVSLVLTMCRGGTKSCPVGLVGSGLQTLNQLLRSLKHPYIATVRDVDYVAEKQLVVCVQPLYSKGSLKDVIYGSRPLNEWTAKYSLRKSGLPPDTIALYGRQVLEALAFLYAKGFPPLGHLHTGNIMVEGKRCRLSGHENTLLGYKTRNYKMLLEYKGAIDVVMFGHALFEMACGYELTGCLPSRQDYHCVKSQPVLEVLKFIFQETCEEMPAVQEVLEHPFFQAATPLELKSWSPQDVKISSECRAMLKSVSGGQPQHIRSKRRRTRTSHSKERSSAHVVAERSYPVTPIKAPPPATLTPSTHTTTPAPTNRPAPKPSATGFPPPPPPPPPSSSSHPPPPKRGALLKDINKGKRLRPTITNDRSAPIL